MENQQYKRVILNWSEKFPLNEALSRQKEGKKTGVYMWGFKDLVVDEDVIWYVGKATKERGEVLRRLSQHYLNLIGGLYEIPIDYLPDKKQVPGTKSKCERSGWSLAGKAGPEIQTILKDWTKMKHILESGHRFANEAFARIAVVKSDDAKFLDEIERQVIHRLKPTVNKQRSVPKGAVSVEFD